MARFAYLQYDLAGCATTCQISGAFNMDGDYTAEQKLGNRAATAYPIMIIGKAMK
jgi:hypothetical protein